MWQENELKPITAVANETDELIAYYKIKGSSVNFIEISEEFEYRGDNIHELVTSFPTGDYMIRTDNITTGAVSYISLSVQLAPLDRYSRDTNNKVSSVLKKLTLQGY